MSYVRRLQKLGIAQAPARYAYEQLQYEVIMGSFAYGVSNDTSDMDIYGFCIPNKNIIFPHITGKYIYGYDNVPRNFEQWQQHHLMDETFNPPKEFDITIYNIVKYFKLCADGNPNMVDSLFVPQRCVTHCTQIGNLVRENRKMFLSKKCWVTFKGYAYSQMHKMRIKNPQGKRKKMVEKYGYDVKFAYHVVRLLGEIEQILLEGDVDLERNREQLKSIRRGEWKQIDIEDYFETKERDLESLYLKSDLPHKPRTDELRDLLFRCLEMHGFKDEQIESSEGILLTELKDLIGRYEK